MTTRDILRGSIVALVTPLTADGDLDEAGLERVLKHVVDGGVSGVAVLGSTGECASVPAKLRARVLGRAVAAVRGAVPVLTGVAQCALQDALAEIEQAAELGAAAVLVPPPFYYLAEQGGVKAYFERVAARSALPVVLYHIPHLTKVPIAPAAVAELAKLERIIGIKDSSRDFENLQQLLLATRFRPDFRVVTGTDTLLVASLQAGAHGTICASANVAPRLSAEICRVVGEGRVEEARAVQERLIKVVAACRKGTFPSGWKAALGLLGLCGDAPALPLQPLGPALRDQLRSELVAAGVL